LSWFAATEISVIFIVLAMVVCLAIFGPSIWVRRVMSRHAQYRDDLHGTGGELARHLLDQFDLQDVQVEVTLAGDHYDPTDRAVRLSVANYAGQSITAVAVAAHEVGHAIQHRDNYGPMLRRQVIVRAGVWFDRVGSAAFVVLSVLGGTMISPRLLLIGVIAIVAMGLARVIAQLSTLPVEFDASFERALPILDQGGYLVQNDLAMARQVLRAAAYTYLAGTLAQIVNFARLIR
jgi:hypothetical protein